MLVKIILVVIILLLLRSHMGIFKPFWPVIVAFLVGAFLGWQMVNVLTGLEADVDCFENLGCPIRFVKPLFALIGGLVAVKPVSTACCQSHGRRCPLGKEGNKLITALGESQHTSKAEEVPIPEDSAEC
jgi:hypothetical protein